MSSDKCEMRNDEADILWQIAPAPTSPLAIRKYFNREVLPHVSDAWIDESKTVKGYEINFTEYFCKYKPLRSLEEIRADLPALGKERDV